MEKCSYFIKNKCLFGCYPTQEFVNILENIGVRYFINLTLKNENNIIEYKTNYNTIFYPIKDHKVPFNWKSFATFIIKISNIIFNLKDDEKLYIHCRAGYSRSPLVVSCLLSYIYNYPPEKSILLTNKYFLKRIDLKEKHRKIGFPQNNLQKAFILKFFQPLYIKNNKEIINTSDEKLYYKHFCNVTGFCSSSNFKVKIHDKIFETADYAISDLLNTYNDIQDKEKFKNKLIYFILKLKFIQHKYIKENLLRTGLRPIILLSENNNNLIGEILTNIRNDFFISHIKQL